MRLAMRLPAKKPGDTATDSDPREGESAEIIDLASRNAFPAVTQRKGKSDGFGLAAGVAVIGLIGAITLWSMNAARTDQQQVAAAPQPVQPAPVVPPQAVTTVAPPQQAVAPRPDPAPQPVYAQPVQQVPGVRANPYSNPTVVFDASNLGGGLGEAVTGAPGQATPGGGSANDFASRVGGVGGAPAQASAMVNPQTTVTQGTLIPAVLETAINTDVPGYVRAVVSQDVRSFDGTRILVPRSSRLIGQYQSGLQGGQKRAYVIWTRLIRPDGASVNLASPAVGFDGTTGLEGKVNSHFFKRFGSSMLLSVIGGLATGGASVVLGGGTSAASTALQQDGQIAPTVRVRAGEPIRVFTARDLDFSAVK
ncbi:Type IV secretion system protein virB10 [Tsuneonella dongtanensis]|uniref:Type IV secretion system protein virB10 n=1 Tax=Tsuneonella dongtanensis TaxID=692370 RepID=A0A1B2ABH0_9SPHN|nr:TrbI/VirB10 family protein [Tsuneonella dongtanensis]ANY19523.1 Type IV secretion system protein virB10 [Tsuneonella dongtanensis]